MSNTDDVRHNEAASRFELVTDEGLARLDYVREGDQIVYTHTEVPEAMEGGGIGSALARAALDHARDEGLAVVAQYPFVARYIERHKEYRDLVAR